MILRQYLDLYWPLFLWRGIIISKFHFFFFWFLLYNPSLAFFQASFRISTTSRLFFCFGYINMLLTLILLLNPFLLLIHPLPILVSSSFVLLASHKLTKCSFHIFSILIWFVTFDSVSIILQIFSNFCVVVYLFYFFCIFSTTSCFFIKFYYIYSYVFT